VYVFVLLHYCVFDSFINILCLLALHMCPMSYDTFFLAVAYVLSLSVCLSLSVSPPYTHAYVLLTKHTRLSLDSRSDT
jgi:hypothetical protein